ncbi:nitroreductase family protein [Escherichia marmotae]|nr:nitroreductase family protein [Escherichia marmotae]
MLISRVKRKIQSLISLELNFLHDYWRFKKYYTKGSQASKDKQKLESWILQDKHRIEKAFSLPKPKLGFGKDVIPRLIDNLVNYSSKFGNDQVYYIGLGALLSYKRFHDEQDSLLPEFYSKNIGKIRNDDFLDPQCNVAGYFKKDDSLVTDKITVESFMNERRSCRHFDVDESLNIEDELLKDITKLSITAPSVCNRQHWRIHYFSGELKNKILSYQNGNTGFTENIPYIAVITSDLRAFYSTDERNQPYTDGGIFAMNFMYALQHYGLASCPLNWCNSSHIENEFRETKLIPDYEVVVLVVAFGYPNKDALYAKSPRLSLNNFYTIN